MRALITVWLGWLFLMAGVNVAAPLYGVYADRFGFSSLVLTLIFATYALVLAPALLLFGRLSDRFGRRPVILAGLGTGALALVVFAAADATVWLFVARALQGLAVGLISGAATAALVELDPSPGGQRPALLAGLAQAVGSGLGPLVAGVLAQWAPAPRQLSYLVLLGVTVVAAGFTLRVPGVLEGEREPWRVQRPRVPSEIRGDFARVSVTAAVVWGAVALYISIVPSYTSKLLHTDNLALLGAVGGVALGASALAQVASQRRRPPPQAAQVLGLVLLAVGLLALSAVGLLHSVAILLVGAVTTGVGHGLGFVNAQDELNQMVPGERRGEVTAAFICCIYVVVGISVIATGVLDLRLKLATSVGAVAVVLATAAAVTAWWQLRVARRRSLTMV